MKKILVIDDAEYILESTSTLLEFEGYTVATASNGAEGVEKAINGKPDIILCDISMPEMDGYQVLDKIKSEIKTKTIPFIFLTAFTDKSNLRAGMERGADDYLFKPFTRDELTAAIEAQFKKSTVMEEKFRQKVDEISRNITQSLPHEFRTVLNQIIGSAKFINTNYNRIEQEDLKELSDDIVESAQRLTKITENYLIYARIEAYNSNPEKRNQLRLLITEEPDAIVSDIAKTIAAKFNRESDLVLQSNNNGVRIEISSESYYKILAELIDNAFRFSSAGSSVIVETSFDDIYQYVGIKDSGRGMSTEQISAVGAYVQFDRKFYEQQGVGLGLSIAKKLVELHDGLFDLNSKIGKGTSIRLGFISAKS
ncbi:MAG: response regulator [Candidatus Kapaibacterium sp.]